MSKTYRFRNKDNTPNKFAKHCFLKSSSRISKDEYCDTLASKTLKYTRDGRHFYCPALTVHRSYRNLENRSKRMRDKQIIHRNFYLNDTWDDVTFEPRKNDASWNWG